EIKIPFYRTLSEKAKVIFRKRVRHFIINKHFVSATEIEVTEEMKVMIAASSVQILFGRDAYYLSDFHTIEILENNDVPLKELKRTKRIHISWEAFKIGHALADGNNPGIKTMAMALSLEYQFSKKSIFNRSAYLTFDKLYKQQAEKYIQSGKSAYKEYGEVDRNEYFGVAVEYFFEQPEDFYTKLPAMYIALSRLLCQDPLGNFKYKRIHN
ncbi:MAG: zinc-dependent peptidase, partial [Cytophagales bacterium]|nr:zinc-dependent peptidase [Cytophaga sp.]